MPLSVHSETALACAQHMASTHAVCQHMLFIELRAAKQRPHVYNTPRSHTLCRQHIVALAARNKSSVRTHTPPQADPVNCQHHCSPIKLAAGLPLLLPRDMSHPRARLITHRIPPQLSLHQQKEGHNVLSLTVCSSPSSRSRSFPIGHATGALISISSRTKKAE
jgi:hypothetical protein